MRAELPKIYSQDLLNNLFRHPYTKPEFVSKELGIHRNTARKYLDRLSQIGLLEKHKVENSLLFVNIDLYKLLSQSGQQI